MTRRLMAAILASTGVHALLLGLVGIALDQGLEEAADSVAVRLVLKAGEEKGDGLVKDGNNDDELTLGGGENLSVEMIAEAAESEEVIWEFSSGVEVENDETNAAIGDEMKNVEMSHWGAEKFAASSPSLPRTAQPYPIEPIVPEYPTIARRTGLDGIVILDIDIDSEGRPIRSSSVDYGSHRLLKEAAVKAAMSGRYMPGMENDVPVGSTLRLRFVFQLNSKPTPASL